MSFKACEGKLKLKLISEREGHFICEDKSGKRYLIKDNPKYYIRYQAQSHNYLIVDSVIVYGESEDEKVHD